MALQISSGLLPALRRVIARFLARLASSRDTLLGPFCGAFCLLRVMSTAGPWALVLNISSNSSTFRSWRGQCNTIQYIVSKECTLISQVIYCSLFVIHCGNVKYMVYLAHSKAMPQGTPSLQRQIHLGRQNLNFFQHVNILLSCLFSAAVAIIIVIVLLWCGSSTLAQTASWQWRTEMWIDRHTAFACTKVMPHTTIIFHTSRMRSSSISLKTVPLIWLGLRATQLNTGMRNFVLMGFLILTATN